MNGSEVDARLAALDQGFRRDYLDFARLSRQLQAWADAFPDLARLESLGRSPEGRELWLLTLGPEPDRVRPAVWVDGNLHASELAGSSVALAIAEDVLRLHLAPDSPLHGLPAALRDGARQVLFHIMPRISPDGAEAVLAGGRYVRSVPRDHRLPPEQPRWVLEDVDGDGLALALRRRDPTGDYVESTREPGLMLQRLPEDEGPAWRVYPEGRIRGFDGQRVPAPEFLSDNSPDLNRNFPYRWSPEPAQEGAGPYPASEPESRAIVEFASAHPNLFAWFNLHTFGGVYIRPPGHYPDADMDRGDLAVYRQLADWARRLSGYPTVSGHEEFTYQPGRPLHGDLTDYAYHQRGCLAVVCELWDLFAQLGIPRRTPFVDHYTHTGREELERLAAWDREHNAGRVVRPWRPVEHPQLGPVEVGGWDPRVGVSNPPYERLPEICAAQAGLWLRVAGLAPRPCVEEFRAEPLADGLSRVEAVVANHGYLATCGLPSAAGLPWNTPPRAVLSAGEGRLAVAGDGSRELGHLAGWGRGLHGGGVLVTRRRHTHAQGAAPARGSPAALGRLGAEPLGYRHGVGFVGPVNHDQEFLTAQPAGQVPWPQGAADQVAQGTQRPIAGGVAQGVVDALEMVHIHDQQRRAMTRAPA